MHRTTNHPLNDCLQSLFDTVTSICGTYDLLGHSTDINQVRHMAVGHGHAIDQSSTVMSDHKVVATKLRKLCADTGDDALEDIAQGEEHVITCHNDIITL